jgi:hypothetical protein
MWAFRQLVGLRLVNPLDTLTADVSGAQLLTASGQLFTMLTFQYVSYFALIVPINWAYRLVLAIAVLLQGIDRRRNRMTQLSATAQRAV